jgi:hypothetical protein
MIAKLVSEKRRWRRPFPPAIHHALLESELFPAALPREKEAQ